MMRTKKQYPMMKDRERTRINKRNDCPEMMNRGQRHPDSQDAHHILAPSKYPKTGKVSAAHTHTHTHLERIDSGHK